MAALAHVGPLAINIDASIWHTYESGIFDGCSYTEMEIDHGKGEGEGEGEEECEGARVSTLRPIQYYPNLNPDPTPTLT